MVVISPDTKHLNNIRKKAHTDLTAQQSAKVYFLEPENFHLFLESLQSPPDASIAGETKVKGYKIRTGFKQLPESETEAKKKIVAEILSNPVKRKGKK